MPRKRYNKIKDRFKSRDTWLEATYSDDQGESLHYELQGQKSTVRGA